MEYTAEYEIVNINPSQLLFLHRYLLLLLVFIGSSQIPVITLIFEYIRIDTAYIKLGLYFLISLRAFYLFIKIATMKYEISSQRLLVYTGIFTRKREEIELYRIKDYQVVIPFVIRIFGLGHIRIHTSDKSTPIVELRGLRKVYEVTDQLRECVEEQRRLKGVREFD
jgi:uncharacterized membrane protein YdbT with pleckstrin-like domain